MTRRKFVLTGSMVVAGRSLLGEEDGKAKASEGEATVRIGIVTDLHYADKPTAGSRHYRESTKKLGEAMELFKEEKPDFIVELGDLVDAAPTVEEETAYLKTIDAVMKSAELPVHYVFGNHCLATLKKEEFLKVTGAKKGYYSFDVGGVHFVVLDACFNKKMEPYGRGNFVWTDTNIPKEEQDWLREDLAGTNLPVIAFVHQRLDLPEKDHHGVRQSPAVRGILEESGKVRAVFQGHTHKNDLREIKGISYCTVAAMVEGSGEENSSYGILEVSGDGAVTMTGYRKLEDRRL